MYCLVDFRNRPQFGHTFKNKSEAKKHLRRIKNNSLGATVFYFDGRREYFENGLPQNFSQSPKKYSEIKKGCHIKYKIREFNTMDGLIRKSAKNRIASIFNWNKKSTAPLFMLGNQKFYACLLTVSILFFSFAFLFQKYLGQKVTTRSVNIGELALNTEISGEAFNNTGENYFQLADENVIINLLGKVEDQRHDEFKQEILKYVKNKPMEAMAPYIAQRDRTVAAFLVGIAMKESKFGVYSPKKNGRDCYNYWGYRGRENPTASGYSCFSSPEQAVEVVGNKIERLTQRGIKSPAQMISWKCGSSCAGHSNQSVRKWIADVGIYFRKINS